MLPIQERVKEAYKDRPDLLELVDESVIDLFALSSYEVKTLCALLLAGNVIDAVPLTGLKDGLVQRCVQSLVMKELIALQDGVIDFSPAQRQLRVQEEEEAERAAATDPPPVRIVCRSLKEQVLVMVREAPNSTAGLARVYAFLYGRGGKVPFPLLGKMAKELGSPSRTALFLLQHAADDLGPNPLQSLLPLAIGYGKVHRDGGFRPDDAPDPDQLKADFIAMGGASWLNRMRKWQAQANALGEPLERISLYDEPDDYQPVLTTKEQYEADRKQYKTDVARWVSLGRPEFT